MTSTQVECNVYMGIYENDKDAIDFVRELHRQGCIEAWMRKDQFGKYVWHVRMINCTSVEWITTINDMEIMVDHGVDVLGRRG